MPDIANRDEPDWPRTEIKNNHCPAVAARDPYIVLRLAAHVFIQYVVHLKTYPRHAIVSVTRCLEQIDLSGIDAKAGVNMKPDLTQKPLRPGMLSKPQCRPAVSFRSFSRFESNTDGERRATGQEVPVCDIDPVAPSFKPHVYSRLRARQSDVKFLCGLRRSEKRSLQDPTSLAHHWHVVVFAGEIRSNSSRMHPPRLRSPGRLPIRPSM